MVVGLGVAALVLLGVVASITSAGSDGDGTERSAATDLPSDPACIADRDSIIATVGIGDGVPVVEQLRSDEEPSELVPGWLASQPAISPDGTRVVVNRAIGDYSSAGPDAEELWVIGVDGSDPVQLTSDNYAIQPSWSPDGRSIVFLGSDADHQGYIGVIDADGAGKQRRVLTTPVFGGGSANSPRWSPDGSNIAFGRGRDLFLVDVKGGNQRTIATMDDPVSSLVWDPGGDSLTVTTIGGEPFWTMERVDIDSGDRTPLGPAFQARWSDDGQRLYVLDLTDGSSSIRMATVGDGGELGPESAVVLDPPLQLDQRAADFGLRGFDVGPCS